MFLMHFLRTLNVSKGCKWRFTNWDVNWRNKFYTPQSQAQPIRMKQGRNALWTWKEKCKTTYRIGFRHKAQPTDKYMFTLIFIIRNYFLCVWEDIVKFIDSLWRIFSVLKWWPDLLTILCKLPTIVSYRTQPCSEFNGKNISNLMVKKISTNKTSLAAAVSNPNFLLKLKPGVEENFSTWLKFK